MANFEKIDAARKTLNLPDSASLQDIKSAYRKLATECHPDKLTESDKKKGEALFKKITEARDIIMHYCANYRYSFKKDDVDSIRSDQDFEHDFMKQFYDEWLENL